jgi:MinD superfamily P-loop ATPase
MENIMENQMKKETMFNTPDYEALDYLFNTIYKQMVSCNLLCDKYIDDNDCELAKEVKESNPFSIISLMQIKNFIVTNTPTDGCDDCAYLSMDTDAVVNVCPECAEERT